MNDTTKDLITGATIAVFSAAAGGILVAWAVKIEPGTPKAVVAAQSPQPPAIQTSSPGQLAVMPQRQPGNVNIRPGSPSNWHTSPAAFQKVQDQPDVRKAREAFMEAQKKYIATMQAAMGKSGGAVQLASAGGKGLPLMIHTLPAGNTNVTIQAKGSVTVPTKQ